MSTESGRDPRIALKDLDLAEDGYRITLNELFKDKFAAQIVADAEFFAAHNVNDYSLLLGIHRLAAGEMEKADFQNATLNYVCSLMTDKRPRPFYQAWTHPARDE